MEMKIIMRRRKSNKKLMAQNVFIFIHTDLTMKYSLRSFSRLYLYYT